MTRVNKQLRNLLMTSSYTLMLNTSSCEYMGKKYTFAAITDKDRTEFFMKAFQSIEKLGRSSWLERLFGK